MPTDITEIKQYQVDLERSNKDLEQFAYVASHDLQEPVRKVVSYSQLFERKFKNIIDEDGKRYINFIVSGAKRMQTLIQDLLKYARVSQNYWSIKRSPLFDLVKEAMSNLEVAIKENNVQVIIDDLPEVNVNRVYMVQLFQNLISNAIKYRGDQDPIIKISSKKDGQNYIISVEDNGMGIQKNI